MQEYIDAVRIVIKRRASIVPRFDEWPQGFQSFVFHRGSTAEVADTPDSDAKQSYLVIEHDVVVPVHAIDDFDVVQILKRSCCVRLTTHRWLPRLIAKKGLAFLCPLYWRPCSMAGVSPNRQDPLGTLLMRVLLRIAQRLAWARI